MVSFNRFRSSVVDDATLAGVPPLKDGVSTSVLRTPDSVIVDPGGRAASCRLRFSGPINGPAEAASRRTDAFARCW